MENLATTPAPASGTASPGPQTEAAAAAAPTPATGGVAPDAAKTPYQRRKEREAERTRKAAERRAAREAKKTKPAAAADDADDDQADDDEGRDDAQRARETGGFWRLTLRVVSLLLMPFGYRLDPLTDKECAEDVALLAPLARRHRWLDVLVRYAALPYLLAERIAGKVKKRDADPAKTPTAPPKGAAKP